MTGLAGLLLGPTRSVHGLIRTTAPTRRLRLPAALARLYRVHVASVEDTTVQVTFWAPPGEIGIRGGDHELIVEHPGGSGGAVLHDLTPARPLDIEVRQGKVRRTVRARTLPSPPGLALARVATISDLHLGSGIHGLLRTMADRSGHDEPAPLRCARGAIRDAAAWQPDLLVGKGDLTQHGWIEEWHLLGELLDAHADGIDRLAVPGNHDKPARWAMPAAEGLARAGLSNRPIEHRDLDGVRVIVADTAVEGTGVGMLHHRSNEIVSLAADAARDGRAALICLHHPLERAPIQLQYPKGVPWVEGRRFARDLARANPNSLITAGHSHRNRHRRLGPLVHTEVGSTKDWPGVWAGYAVHEGGIRQVVRRISAPDALSWIDYSRWAAGGLWWPYSPGRLRDRCFTHCWAKAPSADR